MTADAVREKLEARPFAPFQLRLPDGRALPVPHPEFMSIAPDDRIAILWKGEGARYWTVDMESVSDMEPIEDTRTKKKRR